MIPVRALLIPMSLFLWTLNCLAGEVARLKFDLDGDRQPEVIRLSVDGDGDFRQFSVSVRRSTYKGKYFAVEGDLPEVRSIKIDYRRPERQLLITAGQAASCDYHILAYSHGQLIPLLTSTSEGCEETPVSLGNGELEVQTWRGFWKQRDRFRLNQAGTKLTLEPATSYDVGVSAAANTDIVLDPDTCEARNIPRGAFVRIERYEPRQHRYLLMAPSGACGWLDEERLDNALSEVPYAR